MANTVKEELKDIKQEAEQVKARSDVKDNVDSLKNDVADLAASVKRLAETELGATAGEVQDAAQRGIGQLEQQVRRNPTQSAMIAAGVGFVVGLLLAR